MIMENKSKKATSVSARYCDYYIPVLLSNRSHGASQKQAGKVKVIEDYEAELSKASRSFFGNGKGELKIKHYSDGGRKLDLSFEGIKVPDRSTVALVIDSQHVLTLPADRGRCQIKLQTHEGARVPQGRHGQSVEILCDEKVKLKGTLKLENRN